MKRILPLIALLVLAGLMAACVTPPPQPLQSPDSPDSAPAAADEPPAAQPPDSSEPPASSGDVQSGLAVVESVTVQLMESFPVQVNVVAAGYLPDGCTTIDQTTTEKNGNEFVVTITTQRPADAMCTEAIVPYEEVIPLDVVGLPAGQYTVTVNGVSASFVLDTDNG